MAPKWLKIVGSLGLAIAKATIPGVAAVESIAQEIPGLHGKAKQDAVLDLVKASLSAAEGITQKDLLDDSEVQTATRNVIDTVVALQNIIATKTAASTTPPAS